MPRSILSKAVSMVGLGIGGLMLATASGTPDGAVIAVFPPWWDSARTMAAASASGPILRLGTVAFAVLVLPEPSGGRARLWQSGAWLQISSALLAGCAPTMPDVALAGASNEH